MQKPERGPIIDCRKGAKRTESIFQFGGMRIPISSRGELVLGTKDTQPINQLGIGAPRSNLSR